MKKAMNRRVLSNSEIESGYSKRRKLHEFEIDMESYRNAPPKRKVKKVYYVVIGEHACWECVSHNVNHRYPTINLGYGQVVNISNIAYISKGNPIPKSCCVTHFCDNSRCIRPDHLGIGTQQDNMDEKKFKKRQSRGGSHGNAKVNETAVRRIRQDTRSSSEIAKEFRISKSQVYKIRSRRRWAHIL